MTNDNWIWKDNSTEQDHGDYHILLVDHRRKKVGNPKPRWKLVKYYEMVPRLKELSQRDSGLRTFWHSKRSPVTKVALSLHLFLQDHTIMQGFVLYDTFGNIWPCPLTHILTCVRNKTKLKFITRDYELYLKNKERNYCSWKIGGPFLSTLKE